jgi:hypothetical protein
MRVECSGEIDENADLDELSRRLSGNVELDLYGVSRINSCGVREWVNFVRGLDHVDDLAFSRCSPSVVLQLNTIYNFRGGARVISFVAPYLCESCHHDEQQLLVIAEHFPRPTSDAPVLSCPRCKGDMVFDELPERYLSFLAELDSTPPRKRT